MDNPEIHPPGLWLRFFRWFCHPDCVEDIEGDLHEIYQRNANEKGEKRAVDVCTSCAEVVSPGNNKIIR